MAYNVLNMLFPFLTSMYIARVLLPVSIGEVTYANNIVCYFTILAFLGIPTYGLREIANARDNKEELNKVFSELNLKILHNDPDCSRIPGTSVLALPGWTERRPECLQHFLVV